MAKILSIVLPLIGCIASDRVWPALSLALHLLMRVVRIFELLQGVFCHRIRPAATALLMALRHPHRPQQPGYLGGWTGALGAIVTLRRRGQWAVGVGT